MVTTLESITRGNSSATSSGDVGNRGSDNGITTEQVDNSVSLYKYSSTNLTTLLLESGNTSGNETDVDNSIITSMPYHLSSSPSVLCNYNNFINIMMTSKEQVIMTSLIVSTVMMELILPIRSSSIISCSWKEIGGERNHVIDSIMSTAIELYQ